MKIGFFGGCFNPPTLAHINLAKRVLVETTLDKVIFVPVGDFYNKEELAPAQERYNMLKIACEESNNFEVSDIEIGIKDNLYAIDAFNLIKNNYPEDDIYFIMGADNFINIMNWKDSKKLIKQYKYIVLERENIDIEKFIKSNLIEYTNKIHLIKNQEYRTISSSQFRTKAKHDNSEIQEIIPNKIMEYIKKNKLYN